MNNRILFCATVDYHFKAFHLPYMKWFKDQGWIVDVAAAGTIQLPFSDHRYNIPIQRSPLKKSNFDAYKQLKTIIDQNNYSIIHCHTPLGGLLTRLAARRARKNGVKIIYTAHGFHFCKGVPLINWLIFYPIERNLSRFTDSLITINQEDYQLATKHRFPAKEIRYIPGVGVDTERFQPMEPNQRKEMKIASGYQPDDFLLCHVGEFNKNKNQQFLLHAFVHILKVRPNAKLILAGEGILEDNCKTLAKELGIDKHVIFLGFRNDIDRIMPICDVAVSASKREGLPVNILEAMACGLPVVAIANRGHRELVQNNVNGWLVEDLDAVQFAEKITTLFQDDLKEKFGDNGRKIVVGKYSTNIILRKKSYLYKAYMEKGEDVTWITP